MNYTATYGYRATGTVISGPNHGKIVTDVRCALVAATDEQTAIKLSSENLDLFDGMVYVYSKTYFDKKPSTFSGIWSPSKRGKGGLVYNEFHIIDARK